MRIERETKKAQFGEPLSQLTFAYADLFEIYFQLVFIDLSLKRHLITCSSGNFTAEGYKDYLGTHTITEHYGMKCR